jgi:hypothetical protein
LTPPAINDDITAPPLVASPDLSDISSDESRGYTDPLDMSWVPETDVSSDESGSDKEDFSIDDSQKESV